MTDLVRVADSGSGVYYAPQYLALELGFFAEEGLHVETEVPGGARLVEYLSSGRADVAPGWAISTWPCRPSRRSWSPRATTRP